MVMIAILGEGTRTFELADFQLPQSRYAGNPHAEGVVIFMASVYSVSGARGELNETVCLRAC